MAIHSISNGTPVTLLVRKAGATVQTVTTFTPVTGTTGTHEATVTATAPYELVWIASDGREVVEFIDSSGDAYAAANAAATAAGEAKTAAEAANQAIGLIANGTTKVRANNSAGDPIPTVDDIDAFLGTGANTVTINVKDSHGNNVEDAFVRMTAGAQRGFGYTNASGNITLSLDAATYTLAITYNGYQFTPTSETITGNTTLNRVMTVATVPEADAPAECAVYLYAYQADGLTPAVGSVVYFRLKTAGGTGRADLRTPRAVIAAANGLVTINLPRGFVYEMKYTERADWTTFTVASAASQQLPSIVSAVRS